MGRAGFDVSTLYEMGYREGLEPAAHEIADQLLTALLPILPLGEVQPEDQPYLERILMVAAQVGAGIGIVEARTLAPPAGMSDRRIWGVLWRGLRDLPEVPAAQRFAAAYLMQAGHFIARTGDAAIPRLRAELRSQTAG